MILLYKKQLQNLAVGLEKVVIHSFTVDPKADSWVPLQNVFLKQVEPKFFMDAELQYDGLTELIITNDMAGRKAKMIELGDAFIAFPGGTGTLEEITEVMSKVSLRHLTAPCILYNLNGYYDSLRNLLEHMIEKGLSSKDRQKGIYFADTLKQLQQIL